MIRLRSRSVALALCLATASSCADIATKPRAEVEVNGVVYARNGAPLAGATVGFFVPVTLSPIPGGPVPPPPVFSHAARAVGPSVVTTDAQGRYSTSLPAATYEVWIGGVADSGFFPLHVIDVVLHPPVTSVPIHYPGYRVTGTIRGPGAVPLAAGNIAVWGDYNGTQSGVENGHYTFLLPRGTYSFSVNPQVADEGVPRITFPGIEVAADTTIDFAVDGNRVEGTVTGPGGTPLSGAYVDASGINVSATSETAADGTFQLYLPSREYRFYVAAGQSYIATRTLGSVLVTAPMTLDFDLSGAEWTGTVRNAATGLGVSGIDLSAFGRKLLSSSYATTSTATDGSFRLVLERGTRYDLAVAPLDPQAPFVVFRSVLAGNDSTFDILLAPPAP